MKAKSRKIGTRYTIISLFILVMLTFTLIGNLIARFTSGVTNNNTEASVAAFRIEETGVTELNLSGGGFYPGCDIKYPITVRNASEVAVNYSLEVASAGNLPLEFKITDENGTELGTSVDLPPNELTSHEYQLSVTWPAEINDPAYALKVDIVTLSLNVVQID